MKKNLKMTPEGTKDFLFAECSAMDYICTSIEKVFVKGGFKRVITPALEFYDVFSIPSSGISQESMFKTTDNKGRLLVARPDSTLPIARMVSTRLKNNTLPVRLYYKQAVYRNNPSLAGRRNEFLQMGVELLGAKGKRADLEILTSAIKSISAVADDFRIELGHAEVFNALSKELDIDNDYKEKIRVSIESKNYSALNNLLDKLKPCKTVSAIRSLPSLFGGEEVFDEAYDICKGTGAENALDYLHSIYKELSVLKNLADRMRITILLVHHTRKCRDNDPFNMISGTTGINGCVDGSMVMIEKQRGSGEAILYCVGRDIENLELHLKRNGARWITEEKIIPKPRDTFSFTIHDFMLEKKYFKGSATTLAGELKMQFVIDIPSNKITQNLVQHGIELKLLGVTFEIKRSCGQRFIILKYGRESDSSDGRAMWVEIAVTAVTPNLTNALPMRNVDSDSSFESDGIGWK